MSEECAKIAVIGLGNAGLPLAAVVADSGLMVIGVDINEERCRQINRGENPIPEEAGLELGQRAPSPLLSLLQNPNPADAPGPPADPIEHSSAQEGGGTIPG